MVAMVGGGTVSAPQTLSFSITDSSLTTHLAPSYFQTATAEKTYMTTTSVYSMFVPFMGPYKHGGSFMLSSVSVTTRGEIHRTLSC